MAVLPPVGPAKRLQIHETARINPSTAFDTTNGTIVIGSELRVNEQRDCRVRGVRSLAPPCARDGRLAWAGVRPTSYPKCLALGGSAGSPSGAEIEHQGLRIEDSRTNQGPMSSLLVEAWFFLMTVVASKTKVPMA
jgi:hypothetical protein